MKLVKLVITHDEFDKQITIPDPKFIPRIGERVAVFYSPPPIVKDVIYDYDNKRVLVLVGKADSSYSLPSKLEL